MLLSWYVEGTREIVFRKVSLRLVLCRFVWICY